MVARVSNFQVTNAFIQQINDTRQALIDKQDEISSGYSVYNASDDAGRAATINSLQSTLQRIKSHKERISYAESMMDSQETAVTSAENVMVRLKELATEAANETISADVRAQMAEEVYQLRDELVALGNTEFQGIYVFGGLDDTHQPFTEDTAFYTNPTTADDAKTHWSYTGGSGTREVNISDSESVRVNTPGNEIFSAAINAAEELGRALCGYRTNVDGTGQPDGTGSTFIQPDEYDLQTEAIRSAMDDLDAARTSDMETELSSIGARVNRLETTSTMLDNLKISTDSARSAMQDSDIYEAATDFTNLKTALQGLLSSGSTIEQLSLMDFI